MNDTFDYNLLIVEFAKQKSSKCSFILLNFLNDFCIAIFIFSLQAF